MTGPQALQSRCHLTMKFPDFVLSCLAAAFGIAGSLLIAMPSYPAWGFGAFLVSNMAWLTVSAWQRNWPLHLQQWVFLGCSLLGLWNWWLAPLLGGAR